MPLQQLDWQLRLQAVRRHGPVLLLQFDDDQHLVQGYRNRLRQLHQHVQGVWGRRRSMLREQYVHRFKYRVQEFTLCCVWDIWRDNRNRGSLLRGQHLHQRLLHHPLRWHVVRNSSVHVRRLDLRYSGHHDGPRV